MKIIHAQTRTNTHARKMFVPEVMLLIMSAHTSEAIVDSSEVEVEASR